MEQNNSQSLLKVSPFDFGHGWTTPKWIWPSTQNLFSKNLCVGEWKLKWGTEQTIGEVLGQWKLVLVWVLVVLKCFKLGVTFVITVSVQMIKAEDFYLFLSSAGQ